MVRMDLKGFHPKKVKRERLTSTDPPFCPPPPDIIPKRLLSHLDQVGGVHWVRGKRSGQLTGVAPPPPPGWWARNQAESTGG